MMFSIIVPVYNAAKYLRPCLDSVLNQTEADWECICVDDGSTDESGEILDEYARIDRRFRIVHQANGGEGVARNAGLKVATGNWITWLDADDLYAVDRLQEARRIIETENPDLLRFQFYMGRAGEVTFGSMKIESRNCASYVGDAAKRWGWQVLAPGGMVWTWVAKRELLEGIAFRPGMRVKEDSIYSGTIANRLNKAVQCEYQSYFYRHVESSAIHAVRKADDCIRLLQGVKALYLSQQPIRPHLAKEVEDAMLIWLRVHSECDILDWIRMREGERCRAKDIYAAYLELKAIGVFDCPCVIWRRYKPALRWWDKTGQIWPLELIDGSMSVARLCRDTLQRIWS